MVGGREAIPEADRQAEMTSTYKNNRDANEREIIDTLRAAGCYVQQMERKDGFDLLVVNWRGVFIMEVKNPAKKLKLTPAEQKLMNEMEVRGKIYRVVTSIEQALNVIQ